MIWSWSCCKLNRASAAELRAQVSLQQIGPRSRAQLTQPPHNRLMDTCCREETHSAILSKEPYLPSHLSMECKDFLRQVCPPVMAALWCWPVVQSDQQAHGCCLRIGWEHIWSLSVT